MRRSVNTGIRSPTSAGSRSTPISWRTALTKILGLIDVLDLAKSHHILGTAFVRPAAWPASMLLAGFKVFFTLVLLHQIFASLRQGKLLAETIADFWSPHEPIHDRACSALPIYGTVAIGPLLGSLRLVTSLTKEQRNEIPLILETIGPSIIPALVRHLRDPNDDVRAIVAAALGHLHAAGDGTRVGRARQRPQRRGAAERRRGDGFPGQFQHRLRAHPARPWPAPRLAGAERSGGLSGGKSDRPPHRPPTRSSWPWRRSSLPWETRARPCGPRRPWHWAESVLTRRRSPPD